MPQDAEHLLIVSARFQDRVTLSRLIWREWLAYLPNWCTGRWRKKSYEMEMAILCYGIIYEEMYRNGWPDPDSMTVRRRIIGLEEVQGNKRWFEAILLSLNSASHGSQSLPDQIYMTLVKNKFVEKLGWPSGVRRSKDIVSVARIARHIHNEYWSDFGNELLPLWKSLSYDEHHEDSKYGILDNLWSQ